MSKLTHKNVLIIIIVLSLAVKLGLFCYAFFNVPSLKFMPDTPTYLEPGINLIEKGAFGTYDENGVLHYEINRTPGYPLFLAILNKTFNLSLDAIVVIQIFLITLAGYMVYKAAQEVDKNIAPLAAFIFLFDQPTTLASLMLLSEALYTLFIAIFIYLFLRYLNERRLSLLLSLTVTIVAATYIRPVSYYIGIFLAGGIVYALYRPSLTRALVHGLTLLLVFYSLLGVWHYRNFSATGNADFTVIDNRDLNHMGFVHKYGRDDGLEGTGAGPVRYYADLVIESIVQFFTLPGTFKYFKSETLRMASKIFGYPWVFFWIVGLFFARYGEVKGQALLLILLYFMLASIFVVGLCVGSRFRVPVMPLVSILSAAGWMKIYSFFKK
ncbi:MAG: glycosyltransferase family 39 protein [Candidatus Omnitrophica bacterium]|nr:glycosyltransferase family 39 protein [Candidatus Omnitrophota bacterium]